MFSLFEAELTTNDEAHKDCSLVGIEASESGSKSASRLGLGREAMLGGCEVGWLSCSS